MANPAVRKGSPGATMDGDDGRGVHGFATTAASTTATAMRPAQGHRRAERPIGRGSTSYPDPIKGIYAPDPPTDFGDRREVRFRRRDRPSSAASRRGHSPTSSGVTGRSPVHSGSASGGRAGRSQAGTGVGRAAEAGTE